MSFDYQIPLNRRRYRVLLVERSRPPAGMEGVWHRYVLGEGGATIEGNSVGTLAEVTDHAMRTAENLNERLDNPYSPAYARRGPKPRG